MKKVLLWLLALTMCVSMVASFSLVGCKKEAAPSEEEAAEEVVTAEEEAIPAEGKTVVRMWCATNPAFIAGLEPLIAAYEAEHADVDIQLEHFDYNLYLQTLQTAMPAGEEADILHLFGSWIPQYFERLAPLPAEVMSLEDAQGIFYKAPLGGYIVDGKLYGLPQEFNCEYGGVLVNKTKFEAAGLTYPPEWKTLDDVLRDAKALTVRDASGMMTAAGFHFTSADPTTASFLSGIKQRGGDYWNSDHTAFTFNTPEAKAQVEWMVNAVEMGVVDPLLFNDQTNFVIDAFFSGNVGIGYIGAWAISDGQARFPDFADEWDYLFLPPIIKGDPVFVADSGWGLCVSPNSEHQDVAWDFVKFATSVPENAMQFNLISSTIPAMQSVAEAPEIAEQMSWVAKALDLLPYGEYLGNMPDRDLIIYEIIYPHLLNVLQGVETVSGALETIEAEANGTFK